MATANQVDAHVGRRMRQRRESLGLSQGRLGRHLGLTFSQVQKYEKGANRIGAGRLYLLAGFLDVPVQYFFEGLGEEPLTVSPEVRANGRGDLEHLEDAFLSIPDPDTRRSVLALVCSLAATGTPERPKGGQASARSVARPARSSGTWQGSIPFK